MKFKPLVFLIFSIMVCSCTDRPKEALSEDKMVDLLTDIQLAEGYYNTVGPGKANRDAIINSILKKHGVSQAQLDSTVAYYGRNIDDYYKLYGKVEKRIRNLSYNATADESVETDDIWPYSRFASLLSNQNSNGISFSFPADNIESGNLLEWKFRLPNQESVEASLGVEYTNGLVSIAKKNLSGNRSISIELQTDTAFNPKRVFGVMQADDYARPLWVDSIKLVKAPFDSINYYKINSQKLIYPPGPKPKVEPEAPKHPPIGIPQEDSTKVQQTAIK